MRRRSGSGGGKRGSGKKVIADVAGAHAATADWRSSASAARIDFAFQSTILVAYALRIALGMSNQIHCS
jgi:hypothetical protein